ncbi:PepSY domain-containing protein [Streptomyces sp. CB00455]|uniref:PepSY domain-containing protein n=1 Tax=Streptomyces sp. CB00455 TaxID=1703927 RepID=UPI00093BD1CB|nr:PepSY domain-containing protein [Streptomyces sp. CB00455]
MKRTTYISAAASLVLMLGGPAAGAAAVPAGAARAARAATAARADVTAEEALAAALKKHPGVAESLDRDGSVWHVDVIGKDGKSHAELEVDSASGAVTQPDQADSEDPGEHKALLSAKVTADKAGKAAVAAHPGQVWSLDWDGDDDSGKAPYWHVEVKTSGGKTQNVTVDASTGKVTASGADSDDGNDNDNDNN